MPLQFIREDITRLQVDAIVNPTNPKLIGHGGLDGAIRAVAGPELSFDCRQLGGCELGQAKWTNGYKLPARYVIHTVGPVWQGGQYNEEKWLSLCYVNCLRLAKEKQLASIAFPLISTGTNRFPKDKAIRIAMAVIAEWLLEHELTVYLVVYDSDSYGLSTRLFPAIKQYIDDRYVSEKSLRTSAISGFPIIIPPIGMIEPPIRESIEEMKRQLNEIICATGESFSQMLLRLIDEKGLADSFVYKKANLDRKLFSKVRQDVGNKPGKYKPSKSTAVAFAIALELNLSETADLLSKAGYALANNSYFDLIVKYFIERGEFDIHQINLVLAEFKQTQLGARD